VFAGESGFPFVTVDDIADQRLAHAKSGCNVNLSPTLTPQSPNQLYILPRQARHDVGFAWLHYH
jgi:hypothetical protein